MNLVNYDSSSSDDEKSAKKKSIKDDSSGVEELPLMSKSQSSLIPFVNAAPAVDHKAEHLSIVPVDQHSKEVFFNPKYEEIYTPEVGPENPFKTALDKAPKNMLTGYVEPTNIHQFTFENQWRTFMKHGYAYDPSAGGGGIVGNATKADENLGATAFESTPSSQRIEKRKRASNYDSTDLEGYTGPWAKYVDEKTEAEPTGEDKEYLEAYIAKKAKNKKRRGGKAGEEQVMEEKTILHIPSIKDYQERSFLLPPQDTGVNLKSTTPPHRCYIPKKLLHEWNNAHNRGVSTIRLFPKTGHLLLSAGMDDKVKLWELYNNRRLIRTYMGHLQAVKDVCFNNDGTEFLSCSYDRYIKLWNTETGQCIQRFATKKVAHCIKFNPDDDKQHLFLAGCADKKIYCYDTRSGEVVQQYDRHMGAVNSVTFVDGNRRFVSTSDDKSLRVWEWDIPVDFICHTDPAMHSMPAVTLSPNEKWLVCQSLDNQLIVHNALAGFKKARKKVFRGHMVAGFACEPNFSPDMTYLASGDGEGRIFVWDWKTSRQLTRWKAHDRCCISVQWLPHETSKLVSCGWDGNIKLWD